MKKKLLALVVPFCCFSIAYAQTNEEPAADVSKEVVVSVQEDADQVSDGAAPPSFFKKEKGNCGCGK